MFALALALPEIILEIGEKNPNLNTVIGKKENKNTWPKCLTCYTKCVKIRGSTKHRRNNDNRN